MAFKFGMRFVAPAIAGISIAALAVGLAPAAQASPSIATVTARLAALAKKNESLTEQFNRAGVELRATQQASAAAALTATLAQATYERSRQQVRLAIADQYRSDGLGRTSALLTSNSGQNYLDRLSALALLSARRTTVTVHLQAEKSAADAAGVRAAGLAAAALRTRDSLAAQRTTVKAQETRYQALLDRLTAAQQRAFLGAKVARDGGTTSGGAPAGSTSYLNVPAPSRAAAIAVRFALAQQGKPYVFAQAGPGSYDCSGLTMAAWRAAGVSLPHFARWQYNEGHHVSRDQLEPGDLVFFYSPISHVAMYIGNGMIVHAPTTGDVVRVVPLSNFSSDYVGATRL